MSLSMFIATCLRYDDSTEMHEILRKKVQKYFDECDQVYASSALFKKLLQTATNQIEKNPANLYVYVKEVVDEMKIRRLRGPPRKKIKPNEAFVDNSIDRKEGANELYQEAMEDCNQDSYEARRKQRYIKKLTRMLEILHKKVAKLEEKEVDWEEENDSTYIKLQRYRKRICDVFNKLQEYQNGMTLDKLEQRKISFSGTPFPAINQSIERYINRMGKFPDYRDVLKLLQDAYEKQNLPFTPERLGAIAKAAFHEIGEQLQRQRQTAYWNAHAHYLGNSRDPAEMSPELEVKLQKNKEEFERRIAEEIDKYAVKAKEVEPEEVPDGAESKSEDSCDDDDDDDDDDGNGNDDGCDEERSTVSSEGNNFIEKILDEKDCSEDEELNESDEERRNEVTIEDDVEGNEATVITEEGNNDNIGEEVKEEVKIEAFKKTEEDVTEEENNENSGEEVKEEAKIDHLKKTEEDVDAKCSMKSSRVDTVLHTTKSDLLEDKLEEHTEEVSANSIVKTCKIPESSPAEMGVTKVIDFEIVDLDEAIKPVNNYFKSRSLSSHKENGETVQTVKQSAHRATKNRTEKDMQKNHLGHMEAKAFVVTLKKEIESSPAKSSSTQLIDDDDDDIIVLD